LFALGVVAMVVGPSLSVLRPRYFAYLLFPLVLVGLDPLARRLPAWGAWLVTAAFLALAWGPRADDHRARLLAAAADFETAPYVVLTQAEDLELGAFQMAGGPWRYDACIPPRDAEGRATLQERLSWGCELSGRTLVTWLAPYEALDAIGQERLLVETVGRLPASIWVDPSGLARQHIEAAALCEAHPEAAFPGRILLRCSGPRPR